VAGSGTVYAGDRIETSGAPSTIRLSAGPRVDLAPGSAASVHADRLVLASGAAVVRPSGAFRVDANDLQILPEAPDATVGRASVAYVGAGRVQISAEGASYQVKSAEGVLLARVAPGRQLVFAPKSNNSSAMMQINGKIESSGGDYYLTDSAASVRFKLVGQGLDKYVGKKVAVTGNRLTGGGDRVAVTKVEEDDDDRAAGAIVGGAAGAGAGAGAAGAGAAAGAAGAVGASTTAIVAGVGIAAGAATAGTFAYQAITNDDTISN